MKTFKIPVSYIVYGYVNIDAENIEEAIDKAWDDETPLPNNAEYIQGSWEVDTDAAYEIN